MSYPKSFIDASFAGTEEYLKNDKEGHDEDRSSVASIILDTYSRWEDVLGALR